jgi:hypothetical protein
MALTAEQRAFVDWQLAQTDPLTGRRIGDIVAEKGLDPYRDEVAGFAQDQIDRGARQLQAGGAVDTVAPWTQSDWRDRQTAREQAETNRRQTLDREWQQIGAAGGNLPVLGPSNDPNLGNVRSTPPYNPGAGSPPLPGADPLIPGTQPNTGGGSINGNVNTNDNFNAPLGTSGAVYGPDGQMYSSAAAALAAGVTNYSYSKPLSGATNTGLINNAGNQMPTYQVPINPATGGLITGVNDQLFTIPTTVQFPS